PPRRDGPISIGASGCAVGRESRKRGGAVSRFRYFRHHMPYLPLDACSGKLLVIEGTDGTGRSTQASMLKEWLEVQGYGVIDTGWTRSKLVGQAITDAKLGHSLNRLTYCLMYATDLADRMEYQIIP